MQLRAGSVVSFMATTPGCTGEFLRHRHGRAILSRIDEHSPAGDRQDATWIVRAGLADNFALSLESSNYPDCYLRHQNGAVCQQHDDGSPLFAADATFVCSPARNGHGLCLSSLNYPTHLLRHYRGEVYISSYRGNQPWDGGASWIDDISWLPMPAWAQPTM